ncbi:MAG: hypothetical protein KF832_30575 [Caldilineaceae bacterium]|nr:hypothetical protein [Caldilineaceae bacterium]
MSTRLAAHGPDGANSWQQGHIGLAQRQMIITPEDQYERQPLPSIDGQLVLVSDGRLDNRAELADHLRLDAAEVNTLPDSALILRAYERWGTDAPRQLMGDYAFALWDERQQHLFLARSPLGNRPLYYCQTPHQFAFATMLGGLFALPWVPRTLAIETFLDAGPHDTFYAGLKKLPPGSWLRVSQRGVEERVFWQLDLERRLHYAHDEEYVEAFDELFTRAVQNRLRSLYPIGISLSGGLDSSAVAATAARLLAAQGKTLAAFTEVPRVGFDAPLPSGKYADETPLVQAIAERYPNLQLKLVRTTGQDLFADLDALFAAQHAPFPNVSNRVWIEAIHAQAQEQGVRVLLNGAGGNLSVSWVGASRLPELLQQGAWREAWSTARSHAPNERAAGRTLVHEGVLPLLPSRLQAMVANVRHAGLRALFAVPSMATPLRPELLQARHRQQWLAQQFPMASRKRRLRNDAIQWIAGSDYDAANEARFGLSRRDPTCDQRLVEFCFAVPEAQWRRGRETRSLIRRAMAGRLPEAVLHNPKRGMQAADWYEALLAQRATIQADLTRFAENATIQRYLDLPRLRHLADTMPGTGWERGSQFADYQWSLLGGMMTGYFLLWFEANVLPAIAQEPI